ncbi:MAG: hypothetical protein ACLR4W_00350 [Oscillospiraceae bacterium]
MLGQFLRNFGNACRSLGQPVGSLTVFKIGVPMITCKNDRLLELLWFVGYCIEFPTQLAVRIGGGAEWNRRVMYRAIREGYVKLLPQET